MIATAGAAAEIGAIVVAGFLVWLSALAQHLGNTAKRGAGYVMSDRSVAPEMTGFFGRATRTLSNNMESALMFVPPALAVIILGRTGAVSHDAAWAYIAARIVFTISYWFGIPVVRSFAWLAGMICCAAMYCVAI